MAIFSSCADVKELKQGKYITDDGLAWVILQNDNAFIFNRHIATSYDPTGSYSVKGSNLVLHVNDEEEYIFKIKDGELIFQEGDLATSLLETGTVFKLYIE